MAGRISDVGGGRRMSLGDFLFEKLNEEDPWLLAKIMKEYYAMEEEK